MADLKTMVDRELGNAVASGVAHAGAVQQARNQATPSLLGDPAATAATGASYALLSERNPEWLGDYWHRCRALYAGGPRLLLDDKLMDTLFPSHQNEAAQVYQQRRSRAFYLAYAGEIIDHLLAGFSADPIRLTAGVDEAKGEEKPIAKWWSDFASDVSPPGGKRQPLSSFAIDCLRELFLTQSAWVLIDLPARDPDAPPPTDRLDEEQRGLLDPYLCLMPTENVVEWECNEETGELEWVLCHWRARLRPGLRSPRSAVTERWTYWDRSHWERYEITYDPRQAPRPETIVPLVAQGDHAFGVVPLVRLHVPDGLYAMGKLESIAREHFNKRNAVGWAEYKALFAVLYEFLAPPPQGAFTPTGVQQDPNRAVNQVRGQGWSQVRGEKDSAQFIGPDVNAFHEARESCAELMREMHRVMFSMALSANMDAAALQRSGESKSKDAAQIAAILAKVGEIIREGVDVVLDLVAQVRGEKDRSVRATGGEKFDADSISASLAEAVELLNGVPMKSPTFLKRYLYRIYKLALGAGATSSDLAEVREELETAVSAEALLATDTSPPGPADKADEEDTEEPDEEDEEDKPAPAPTAKPRSRRLFSA